MEMDKGFFNSLLTMKKKKPMNSTYSQPIPSKPTLNAKDMHITTTANTCETTLFHIQAYKEMLSATGISFNVVEPKSKTHSLNEFLYQQWLDAKKATANQSMPSSSLDSEKVPSDTSLKGTCETPMENPQALKIGEGTSSQLNILNGAWVTLPFT